MPIHTFHEESAMQIAATGNNEGINASSYLHRSSHIHLTNLPPITCLVFGLRPELQDSFARLLWEIFVDTGTVGSKKCHSSQIKCEAQHVNPCHTATLNKMSFKQGKLVLNQVNAIRVIQTRPS